MSSRRPYRRPYQSYSSRRAANFNADQGPGNNNQYPYSSNAPPPPPQQQQRYQPQYQPVRQYHNQSRGSHAPRGQQTSRGPPPAPRDLLSQYTFDDISLEKMKTLDIYPDIIQDLFTPGKGVCYLTQIITVAENQYKNVGGVDFDSLSTDGYWVGFLTINFPEKKTFTCKHKNKKECKNICSLAAIYYLRERNSVDARLKLNIDTSVTSSFIDNSRGPVPISPIPMSLKQQMMSFTTRFEECVANLIQYQIGIAQERFQRYDIGGIEGKHTAILEGLDPDEGFVGGDQVEQPANPSRGPIDLFSGRPYTVAEPRKRLQAFSTLKRVFSDRDNKCRVDTRFQNRFRSQAQLPIRSAKDRVLEALSNHRAIVVAGDTGCGKSTQVPQFILEDFINYESNSHHSANIAITQPRRISAISLAERVALELGEPCTGHTVGHNVRFDSKQPNRDLNIMSFFTTGMLLRKMQQNPDLKGVTHLVIDEVHERDCTTDFLLILIKRLLVRRKDLKVIFMSASLDASLFSRYFDNCPIVSVSGRCYPVNLNYLDQICQGLRIEPPRDEYRERAPKFNVRLVADLIKFIDETRDDGAILCFMPGWKEMKALQKELDYVRSRNNLHVLLAHSKLPISEQRLIFDRVDQGNRKVILATNIAETSITIDDVKYVIDTGLCNSIDYDPELNMSTFGTRWISQANSKQRSGRAGRTSSGECFKLYTQAEESGFQEYPFPELLRIPLESVILEAKCHCPEEKAASFLSQAIQPPSISAIHNAIDELMLLNVLDNRENLTVLGKRISEFSTHPRISVSIVVASALRCLYPVLNSSAVLSSTQEPFLAALSDKSHTRAVKGQLCKAAISDGRDPNNFASDHIAFGNLLAQYDNAMNSKHELEYFINENNLNRSAMSNILDCRNLYARMMISSKFVTNYEWDNFDSLVNRNMNELELMVGALTYSFYPKVVRIIKGLLRGGRMYPNKVASTDVASGARVRFASDSIVRNVSLGKQLGSQINDDGCGDSDEDSDYLSMASVPEDRRPTFLTYLNSRADQESGQIVIRDGTVVPPISLLLFGGRDLALQDQYNQSHGRQNQQQQQQSNDPNILNIVLDRHPLLSFKISRDDAEAIQRWRCVWQSYLDWYIHTRDVSRPVDANDSIIAGTMNDFLELNKKLYASFR